jgi:hypothetical protein
MVLEMVGFALVWAYVLPVGFEKFAALLIPSMVLGPPSVALAWAATRHLGKQWRFHAPNAKGNFCFDRVIALDCSRCVLDLRLKR